jgi:hypothetical protein
LGVACRRHRGRGQQESPTRLRHFNSVWYDFALV